MRDNFHLINFVYFAVRKRKYSYFAYVVCSICRSTCMQPTLFRQQFVSLHEWSAQYSIKYMEWKYDASCQKLSMDWNAWDGGCAVSFVIKWLRRHLDTFTSWSTMLYQWSTHKAYANIDRAQVQLLLNIVSKFAWCLVLCTWFLLILMVLSLFDYWQSANISFVHLRWKFSHFNWISLFWATLNPREIHIKIQHGNYMDKFVKNEPLLTPTWWRAQRKN